jgi:hypothetical protein
MSLPRSSTCEALQFILNKVIVVQMGADQHHATSLYIQNIQKYKSDVMDEGKASH